MAGILYNTRISNELYELTQRGSKCPQHSILVGDCWECEIYKDELWEEMRKAVHRTVVRVCRYCEGFFWAGHGSPRRGKITCSDHCNHLLKEEKKLAHKIRLECTNCHKEFYRNKSDVNSGNNYCSVACVNEYQALKRRGFING
jgi:hypothetical protein